jgi:hypothetical protein
MIRRYEYLRKISYIRVILQPEATSFASGRVARGTRAAGSTGLNGLHAVDTL